MAKKLSLFMAAIALVVLAVPALASANAKITDPPGTLLSAGSQELIATNIGNVTIQTSLGQISCSTLDLTGHLSANTGTTYRIAGNGTGTANCTLAGKSVAVTDIALNEIHSATTLSGKMVWLIKIDLPGVVCDFELSSMPYTVSGTDTIKITNGDFKATPAACESGLVNGTFTLETNFSPFTQLHLD